MSGIIILSRSEEINIGSATMCEECIHWNRVVKDAEYGLCDVWGTLVTTPKHGWCYKGEEEDTNDLYGDEDDI